MRPSPAIRALAVLVPVLAAFSLSAADWPQFRGPNGDGSSPEKGLAAAWAKTPPKQVWKVPMGEGFGVLAVVGDKAYALAERDKKEWCLCLDAATGKELWATPLDKTIFERQGGNGPRSTPTVDGGKIYCLGTYLRLVCLDAATGGEVWALDLPKAIGNTQARVRGIAKWGSAASPVQDGDFLFVPGGGKGKAFLAIHKKTGKPAWGAGDAQLTHASPCVATVGGGRQVIFFAVEGLYAFAARTGAPLWKHKVPFNISTASTPVAAGDIVYCSAGYGVGSTAVRVGRGGVRELWRVEGNDLANHWTTPVLHDGHLYGICGFKEYSNAKLKCVELATGKVKWSQDGYSSGGATILVDGHVLVQSKGTVVLVEATPSKYVEKGRFQALGGKCWNMAVVAGGRIYVRSIKEAACFAIPGFKPSE